MFQVFCLALAALLITLVVAYFNKPHQYGILWGGALILLIGTMLLLGLGIVDLLEDGHLKPATVFAVVLAIVISCGMAITAQEIGNNQKSKPDSEKHQPTEDDSQMPGTDIHNNVVSSSAQLLDAPQPETKERDIESETECSIIENIAEDVDFEEVSETSASTLELTGKLNTELAEKVFNKAIEIGLITPMSDYYCWNQSIVLLAYMCGKIYSGDYTVYDKNGDEYIWYKGDNGVFPEKSLQNLFHQKNIGQIRRNYNLKIIPNQCQEIDKLFK